MGRLPPGTHPHTHHTHTQTCTSPCIRFRDVYSKGHLRRVSFRSRSREGNIPDGSSCSPNNPSLVARVHQQPRKLALCTIQFTHFPGPRTGLESPRLGIRISIAIQAGIQTQQTYPERLTSSTILLCGHSTRPCRPALFKFGCKSLLPAGG